MEKYKLSQEQREFLYNVQSFHRMMNANKHYYDTIGEVLGAGYYTKEQKWILKKMLDLLAV